MKMTRIALGLIGAVGLCSPALAENGVTKDEIVIGAFLPLQSGLAAGAAQVRDGALAYAQHINDQGGINGRKIKWLTENDSYNPQQAVAATRKLVDRDEIFAVVSPLGTVTAMAVLPYLVQKNIPMIGPVVGSPKLLEPTDRVVFGVLPSGVTRGKAVAQHAVEEMKGKSIAVFSQNDDFGKDVRDGAVEYLKSKGMSIAAEASYAPNDADMSSQVAKLRAANPDVVVLAGIPKPLSLFINEAAKQGWKPKYVGPSQLTDPLMVELSGDNVNGTEIIYDVALQNSPAASEANAILAKYAPQTRPGYFAYNGMIGMMLFAEAVKRAGTEPTREKVITELEKLQQFKSGIFPPISYAPNNHAGVKTFGVAKWENGKLEMVKGW